MPKARAKKYPSNQEKCTHYAN